ncbi:hypothetical protein [Methylobacterium iners]|uniref:Uncharacterized protein n=1 Tax=Methylobacterium iners TaxID=418707 RepID=A0ABQ4S7V3_9HYPH|nr:hypothetical protein [Methylobacterium iners]GJD97755.1 hypothetical protein OCOJLMKI_4988 [Methylobacterium iners]
MAGRKQPKLPSPQQAMPTQYPGERGGTYLSVTRAADRYLAKAEEAIRKAALLWNNVDCGLEMQCDEMAEEVLRLRRDSIETVGGLYGDRLRDGVS